MTIPNEVRMLTKPSHIRQAWKAHLLNMGLDPHVRLGRYTEPPPEWWWLENAPATPGPLFALYQGKSPSNQAAEKVKSRAAWKQQLGWKLSREEVDLYRVERNKRTLHTLNIRQAMTDNRNSDRQKWSIYNHMLLRHDNLAQ